LLRNDLVEVVRILATGGADSRSGAGSEYQEAKNPVRTGFLIKFKWAVQDANTPPVSALISHVSGSGAAKGAAFGADSFTDAVSAIMALPLSKTEKAEAVRRLLGGRAG
jgi:hypothetical protein